MVDQLGSAVLLLSSGHLSLNEDKVSGFQPAVVFLRQISP